MMKKTKVLFATLAAAAIGLTACGGESGAEANGSGDGGSAAAAPVTIVWDMWAGSTDAEALLEEQMAAAQEIVGDDIIIELQTAPWGDYFTKLNANMASGQVACVTGMNGQRMAGYTDAFLELGDDELATAGISRDDYNPGALAVMGVGDQLFGLPYDTATMFLFYNEDRFVEAGVDLPTNDWTLEDFEAAAVQITANTDTKGFVVSLAEFQWLSLPMAHSGTQAVNEDGELALTDPAFLEAATWYSNLVTELGVSDVPPSASETSWDATQFENDQAAMLIEGTWNATRFTDEETLGFKGGAVRLPAGTDGPYGVALGSGYGVAATCEHQEEALKVLGALAGPEVQEIIAEQGGYPAMLESQPKYFESLPEATRDHLTAAFQAGFDGATSQRVTEAWEQVSTAMPNELVSVYTGQTSMEDALNGLQSRFGG